MKNTIKKSLFLILSFLGQLSLEANQVTTVPMIATKYTKSCGYYAAATALEMVKDNSIEDMKKSLVSENVHSAVEILRSNLKNKTPLGDGDIFNAIQQKSGMDRITIIAGPQDLQCIKLGIFTPESLIRGANLFAKNGTPHAIIYNIGTYPHWIAFGIRKENKKVCIYKTESFNGPTTETTYSPQSDSIEEYLFNLFK